MLACAEMLRYYRDTVIEREVFTVFITEILLSAVNCLVCFYHMFIILIVRYSSSD